MPALLVAVLSLAGMARPARADHWGSRNQLIALANATSQDPAGFMEGLSTVHYGWHYRRSQGVEAYGLLLFHNRLVRYFNAIVNSRLSSQIAPYTPSELARMGVPPLPEGLPARVASLEDLAVLSQAIEQWHNRAHGVIGVATGTPMNDPSINIYYVPFWRFHFYIDRYFQQMLAGYANAAHRGRFRTVAEVVEFIEQNYDGWVPYI